MVECRILIVEDDPLVSAHLETIVTATIDADVVVSASVAEARLVMRTGVDFALLDVDVLDGTTYDFAQMLKHDAIPFVFISASDRKLMPADLESTTFIAKPYVDADIVGILQAAKRSSPPTVSVSDS